MVGSVGPFVKVVALGVHDVSEDGLQDLDIVDVLKVMEPDAEESFFVAAGELEGPEI